MDTEPEDRISKLKSGLSEVREQARVQQNTLNHILRLLQGLQISGAPQDPPPAPPVPGLAAPETSAPATSVPQQASHGLKPTTPNDFDGDRWAFLNSCRLYISLCENQFQDVNGVLSFSGQTEQYLCLLFK
jgi:hypothetical protein